MIIDLATLEAYAPWLVGAFVGVFLVLFALDIMIEAIFGDGDDRTGRAASRTKNRLVGASAGALGMIVGVGMFGLEAVAMAPELAITLVGAGWILAGFDVWSFLAAALVTYTVAAAIRGEG